MEISKSHLSAVVLIGLFVLGAAGIRAYGEVKAQERSFADVISFQGISEQEIESDRVKWSVQFSRTADSAQKAEAELSKDREAFLALLKSENVTTTDVSVQPASSYYDQYAKTATASQVIVVESSDVNAVSAFQSVASTKMAERGANFNTNGNEFTVSNLSEIQKQLVLQAFDDAQKQAEQIPGIHVGKVQNMGNSSFTVAPVNSGSGYYGYYGSPDTQSVKKKVTATVYASFHIK